MTEATEHAHTCTRGVLLGFLSIWVTTELIQYVIYSIPSSVYMSVPDS